MKDGDIIFEIAEKLDQLEIIVSRYVYRYPIQDITRSMRDVELQSLYNSNDAIKNYGNKLNHPMDDCIWFWFESPDWTWENLCGRAGWMVISRSELKVIDFFLETMN